MFLSLILAIAIAVLFFNWVSPLWATLLTLGSIYGGICWFRLVELVPYFWKQLTWFGMKKEDKNEMSQQRNTIVDIIS